MSTFNEYLPSSDRSGLYYYSASTTGQASDSPSTHPRSFPPEAFATMAFHNNNNRSRIPSDDFNQWIDMPANNSPLQTTHPIPNILPSQSFQPENPNYQLRNQQQQASSPYAATPSSYGATPSSFGSSSFSGGSPDIYQDGSATITTSGYQTYSDSTSFFNPNMASPTPWQPPLTAEDYSLHSPHDFSTHMASLQLGLGGGPAVPKQQPQSLHMSFAPSLGPQPVVSPRDVMSATVVDGDDFDMSSVASPDFGFLSVSGGSAGKHGPSSYPGYVSDSFSLPLGYTTTSSSYVPPSTTTTTTLFPSYTAPSAYHHHSQSPTSSTQFPLDIEEPQASPASTIRHRDLQKRSRPKLLTSMTSPTTSTMPMKTPWAISAKAAPTTATTRKVSFFSGGDDGGEGTMHYDDEVLIEDESEEDQEDEDDGDDDYVERGPAAIGPHRTTRRRLSSTVNSSSAPTSSSSIPTPAGGAHQRPYARRPSNSSHQPSSSSPPGAGLKKVKAVKWESTKPKYWIPEGFDPYWDQKSRGRGVATVSTSVSSTSSVSTSTTTTRVDDWPTNYLPDDWKELVRGRSNPSRPFVCPAVNCGKTFQRSEHAKRHAWSLHTPDAVKVSCPYEGCDHKSTRGDNLKQHIGSHKRKHSGALGLLKDGGATVRRRKSVVKDEDAAWS